MFFIYRDTWVTLLRYGKRGKGTRRDKSWAVFHPCSLWLDVIRLIKVVC